MEVLKNYGNYKKHEAEYSRWKNKIDSNEAKRQEYLKNNPLSQKEKTEALQRGKNLLNAIDIMDEYSQSKAEDVEVVTNTLIGQSMAYLALGGAIVIGFLGAKLPFFSKIINKISAKHANEISYLLGGLVGGIASIPLVGMATKAQVGASRQGRFEAMRKELDNPALFANLVEEQFQEANQKAKQIKLEKKDLNNIKKADFRINPFGFMSTIKNLFAEKKIYEEQRNQYEIQIAQDKNNFNENLTCEQIENAKKDKQLLAKLVYKIDIESQDYAENIEMLTNIIMLVGLSSGVFTGFLTNKVLKLLKVDKWKHSMIYKQILPAFVSIIPITLGSVYTSMLQKQASRVGRYKIKQELSKDANNFAYVDDEKIKDIKNVQMPEQKKINIFKFFKQAWIDNKEYRKYLKTTALENKKMNKAIVQLNLSPEQLKKAKNVQKNTFRMFNEVDDMSQKYAESIEAIGEILQNTLGTFLQTMGILLGSYFAYKPIFAGNMKNIAKLNVMKIIGVQVAGLMLGLIPSILLEIFITKEQKKASRIANMLAIKNLEDYRNFVDYANISDKKAKIIQNFLKNNSAFELLNSSNVLFS